MHCHFATVCSRIMQFSPKCLEKVTLCQPMQNLYHLAKYSGAVLEENIWGGGQDQKADDLFLVIALENAVQTTKSTTPTSKERSLYNCLLVLLLHTAAVTKDLGKGARLRFGGRQLPLAPM